MNGRSPGGGFTLLEVLLAATMLFIGIAVVLSSLSSSFDINLATEEQNRAITCIQHEVERLKAMPYCDDPNTTQTGTEASPEPGTMCYEFGSLLDTVSYYFAPGLKFAQDYSGTLPANPPLPPGRWTPQTTWTEAPEWSNEWVRTGSQPPFLVGNEPALIKITPSLPNPPNDGTYTGKLIQFRIELWYRSDVTGGAEHEDVTIWIARNI